MVEALFRELEDMSDEDMKAFKAAPTLPGQEHVEDILAPDVVAEQVLTFLNDRA